MTALERSQPIRRLTSNALATLLVCGSEVVAVTTPGLVDSLAEAAGSLTLFAIQEASPPAQPDDDKDSSDFKLNFMALPNPIETLDPFSGKDPNDQYTICEQGTSFWSDIEKNPWCKVVSG